MASLQHDAARQVRAHDEAVEDLMPGRIAVHGVAIRDPEVSPRRIENVEKLGHAQHGRPIGADAAALDLVQASGSGGSERMAVGPKVVLQVGHQNA